MSSSSSNDKDKPVAEDEITRLPRDSIQRLPSDIISDILQRVPFMRCVLSSISVSKDLLALVKDPIFARTQFSNSSICPLLVVHDPDEVCDQTMYLIEGDNTLDFHPKSNRAKLSSKIAFRTPNVGMSIHPISTPFVFPSHFAVSSCEGLVCWTSFYDHFSVVVCNPVTYEYIVIDDAYKESTIIGPLRKSIFIGIGFNRRLNRYVLLRLSERRFQNGNGAIITRWGTEVFILGTGPWRHFRVISEHISMDFVYTVVDQIIYTNGVIYWTHFGVNSVFSFNVEDELFEEIQVPNINGIQLEMPNISDSETIGLGVLGGSMCVSLTSEQDGHVELWMLSYNGSNGNVWTQLVRVDSERTRLEPQKDPRKKGDYRPLKFLESCNILMQHSNDCFFIYDLIAQVELCYFRVTELLATSLDEVKVIPHTPSLISLRDALMDDNVQVFRGQPRLNERRAADGASSSQG